VVAGQERGGALLVTLYSALMAPENAAMANGINGIDHCLVGVHDLETARRSFARLGFTLSAMGRHPRWGTANTCLMFPQNYIELLSIVDDSAANPVLRQFLHHRQGLTAVALATDDAGEAAAALAAAGLAAPAPEDLSRTLELPEGPAEPRFRLLHLPPEATPNLTLMLTQHLDPALVWRPEWQVHANGAQAITAVTVVVDDPEGLIEPYEAIFGAGSGSTTDDTLAVFTGRDRIMFVTPTDLGLLYPGIKVAEDLALPWIAALSLRVADTDATVACLEAGSVPYLRTDDGVVRVAPEEACGVILEFASD